LFNQSSITTYKTKQGKENKEMTVECCVCRL